MAKPKVVYGAAVNLAGLWGPLKMTYKANLKEYYDKSGDFSVKKTGTVEEYGITTFASTDRSQVVAWTKGVSSAMKRLAGWCATHKKSL